MKFGQYTTPVGKHSCHVEWLGKTPVLLENKKIEIAVVPAKGGRLQDCVVLHPRYVPKKVPHEIRKVHGFRRGRTIDVLLETPFISEGKEINVLNFKGAGADADEEGVIHPSLFYKLMEGDPDCGSWLVRRLGDPGCERIWGALSLKEAEQEMSGNLLKLHGIGFVGQLQVNAIPAKISSLIGRLAGGKFDSPLAQLVRACGTNIRISDKAKLWPNADLEPFIDQVRFAETDTALVNAHLGLLKAGKALCLSGSVDGNRHIDGDFTDAENYSVLPKLEKSAYCRLAFCALRSTIMLLQPEKLLSYLKTLEEKTGLKTGTLAMWACAGRQKAAANEHHVRTMAMEALVALENEVWEN